jgi:hypothetical protein
MATAPNGGDRGNYEFLVRLALGLCASTTSLTIYYDNLPAFRVWEATFVYWRFVLSLHCLQLGTIAI